MCGSSCEEFAEETTQTMLGAFATVAVSAAISFAIFFNRRRRKAVKNIEAEGGYDAGDNTTHTVTPDIINLPHNETIEDLEEINRGLCEDLKDNFSEKIKELKADIKVRRLELRNRLVAAAKEKQEEMLVAEAKFKADKEDIDKKHNSVLDQIQIEYEADIRRMKDTLKNLKVVLATSTEDQERLESGRQELECPVCMEEMKPPRRIWQCADGHPVCELCRKKPEVTCCPVCRKFLVGRSTIAEKLARAVFGQEIQEKITLTGYRQVPISIT